MKNILDKINAEQRARLIIIEELKAQLNTPGVKNDSSESKKIEKKIVLLEGIVKSVRQALSDAGITVTDHPDEV